MYKNVRKCKKTYISVSFKESYSFGSSILTSLYTVINFISIRKFFVYITNYYCQYSKCRKLYKTIRNPMKTQETVEINHANCTKYVQIETVSTILYGFVRFPTSPFARSVLCAMVGPRNKQRFINRFLYVDSEYLGCSTNFWRN